MLQPKALTATIEDVDQAVPIRRLVPITQLNTLDIARHSTLPMKLPLLVQTNTQSKAPIAHFEEIFSTCTLLPSPINKTTTSKVSVHSTSTRLRVKPSTSSPTIIIRLHVHTMGRLLKIISSTNIKVRACTQWIDISTKAYVSAMPSCTDRILVLRPYLSGARASILLGTFHMALPVPARNKDEKSSVRRAHGCGDKFVCSP